MKTHKLSITQRIIAVIIYLIAFVLICGYFSDNWNFLSDSDSEYNLLFVSGALLLIFGAYITEPYFAKPVDVITNSIAILLALSSIEDKDSFIGYKILFYISVFIVIISILIIFAYKIFPKLEKSQRILYEFIIKIGQSKVAFSTVYIITLFSYFKNKPIEFSFFLTFWIIFITNFLVEDLIIWIYGISKKVKNKVNVLGEAIGCENPFLYKVEVDFLKHQIREVEKGDLVYLLLGNSRGVIGIVVNEKNLLNKKWIYVYLLENNHVPLEIDLKKQKLTSGSKNIFSKDNTVYILNIEDINDEESKDKIKNNYLYKNKDNFIGYIAIGCDINKIRFYSFLDSHNSKCNFLKEGSVIKTVIYDKDVLYQVIDGKTHEEELEKHNIYGYLTGIAQKLGRYNNSKEELETVKWLPNIYSPVFFDNTDGKKSNKLSIGKLPETNLEIVLKDLNSLVTHNTAILGILGIGKSCLTFELIKKVIENTKAKVVCIDITNEYKKELKKYLNEMIIQEDLPQEVLTDLKSNNNNGNSSNPASWGNEELYKIKIEDEIKSFSQDINKRVLILNPDWHSVSKAGSLFNIQYKTDLTVSEKTRIISERLFLFAKNKWEESNIIENEESEARFLLIFEEAHSLIPEWNSVANSGDQNASNGTAKVILQGRKYGLGSFVITQRTANISKSILNQCNTIFALRVFDDTGKHFLENYIGTDYSNTLPTLEERHAIVVGKALKLKQPVIVRLNERSDIISYGNFQK